MNFTSKKHFDSISISTQWLCLQIEISQKCLITINLKNSQSTYKWHVEANGKPKPASQNFHKILPWKKRNWFKSFQFTEVVNSFISFNDETFLPSSMPSRFVLYITEILAELFFRLPPLRSMRQVNKFSFLIKHLAVTHWVVFSR